MIYNDTSDRSGCHRKRAASEILMMTSSVMPWRWKNLRKEVVKSMETVNYKDLVAIGFPEHTSRNIIRQAKKIAVKKFEEARKMIRMRYN